MIDYTQRLDFLMAQDDVEWLRWLSSNGDSEEWELQFGGDLGWRKLFEAPTKRECIDKAIREGSGYDHLAG